MLQQLVYRSGEGVTSLETIEDVKAALEDKQALVWVDMRGRSAQSNAVLGQVFGFHELAIEDVYKERHRPKVEDYDEYLYIICRGVVDFTQLEDVKTTELDLFLGSNFVVTHHDGKMPCTTAVRELMTRGKTEFLERGHASVYLAHALLDKLVDGFAPVADAYEREIDRIEDLVLAGEDELARIVELRGALHRLRRLALSQREVIASLARAAFDEIPAEAKPFFRDVHEHMIQFAETLEHERDELNAVFEAFHSLSAHRMNEIMKVLTLISTIMLPLTFLAGVYGMNFHHGQMVELDWKYGYLALWGVMIAIAVGMTLFFKKRGWL